MKITVLATHWPRYGERLEYFLRSVHSAKRHLADSTTEHEPEWLVMIEAVDAPPHLVRAAISFCDHWQLKFILHRKGEASLGNSLNMACDYMEEKLGTKYLLYIQDDFVQQEPIPLDADVAWMESHSDFAAIRYMAHPKTLRDTTYLEGGCNELPLLRQLHPRAFYVWSETPMLFRLAARKVLGLFSNDPQNSEWKMNCASRGLPTDDQDTVKIAVRGWTPPGSSLHRYFANIGDVTSMTEKFARWRQRHPTEPTRLISPLEHSGSHKERF
jgi:hypothetical protein